MYKKIEEVPIVVMSTFGHCASDWLGNLLDSHKEILITPTLSFFRKLKEIKRQYKINLTNLTDEQIVDIAVNKILKKSSFKSYNFFQNSKKKKNFQKSFKNLFKKIKRD